MDVWEVPQSSCSGLDRSFLMDVGPPRTEDFGLGAHVDQTDAPYMPTNDSAVENALRTVAVSRRTIFIWGATAGAGRLWC